MFGLDVQSVQVGKGGTNSFFLVFRLSELLTSFFHLFKMTQIRKFRVTCCARELGSMIIAEEAW
jgi:hypothetical protein